MIRESTFCIWEFTSFTTETVRTEVPEGATWPCLTVARPPSRPVEAPAPARSRTRPGTGPGQARDWPAARRPRPNGHPPGPDDDESPTSVAKLSVQVGSTTGQNLRRATP
ncbi:hypothetical protein GCM10010505_45950 [Kitasatospora aburaviensis]